MVQHSRRINGKKYYHTFTMGSEGDAHAKARELRRRGTNAVVIKGKDRYSRKAGYRYASTVYRVYTRIKNPKYNENGFVYMT